MKIQKEIEMTIDIDIRDKDIDEWMEERIADIDILMNDEAKEKMKAIKVKYYEKWMELYMFFQNPHLELEGKDPVPPSVRESCKKYFG